jgi:hypothetical protein
MRRSLFATSRPFCLLVFVFVVLVPRAGSEDAAAAGDTNTLAIKGSFETHSHDRADGKTEAKYGEAFTGIHAAVEVFKDCYHAQVDRLMEKGETDMSEESEALNDLQRSGSFSLACCSNTLCVDDDYDGRGIPERDPPSTDSTWKRGGANGKSVPETGNCVGTAFFDWWRVRCPLVSGRTSLTSIKEQLKTKSMIRLLKNEVPGSGQLTVCEFPRMGKTYAKCNPKELETYDGNYCKKFSEKPEDTFTCGGDDEYSLKWEVLYPDDCADVPEGQPCWACHDHPSKTVYKKAFCQCRVPQGWFETSKALDDSGTCKHTPIGSVPSCRSVVGYSLKLGIADEGGLAENDAWRSVRTCEVTSYEWYNNALEPFQWTSNFEFQQDFVMVAAGEYDVEGDGDLLPFMIFIAFILFFVIQAIGCMRNKVCQCCAKRLTIGAVFDMLPFWTAKRCFWCWLYNSPLPDPTLYAALQARDEHLRGKNFWQFATQGPLTGRYRTVGGKRIYEPPRMKAVDHKFSMQKPIKIKDLMLGYDQKKGAKIAPTSTAIVESKEAP